MDPWQQKALGCPAGSRSFKTQTVQIAAAVQDLLQSPSNHGKLEVATGAAFMQASRKIRADGVLTQLPSAAR
jgi:hypothetical protein